MCTAWKVDSRSPLVQVQGLPCLIAPEGFTILSISSMNTMPSCSATRICTTRQHARTNSSNRQAHATRLYTLYTHGVLCAHRPQGYCCHRFSCHGFCMQNSISFQGGCHLLDAGCRCGTRCADHAHNGLQAKPCLAGCHLVIACWLQPAVQSNWTRTL